MIPALNVPVPAARVVRKAREDVQALGEFRVDACREAEALFEGVSGKRINAALVPGVTRHTISRAINGCDGNPLYRLASWFVLCRRLGIPKARLQRVIDWLQGALDAAYDDAPEPTLEELLMTEQEKDAAEDVAEMRAATLGTDEAIREWRDRIRDRHAYDPTVIGALNRRLRLAGREV